MMERQRKPRKASMTPEEQAERAALRKLKKIQKDRRYRARLKSERLNVDNKIKELEEKIATQQMLIQHQGQQLVELHDRLSNNVEERGRKT